MLPTRFQTATRRPISRVPSSHLDLVGAEPGRRASIGHPADRVPLDRETERFEGVEVGRTPAGSARGRRAARTRRRRPSGGRAGRCSSRDRPLEVEADVQRRGRVGQGPHADPVDARPGQRPDRRQVHPARRFEQDARRPGVAAADGLGQRLGPEVVDQDDVGPALQGPVELVQGVDLDLDELGPRRGLRRGPPRTARPIGSPPASSQARWLSLIRTASYRPIRWFVPPPHRTAYFLQGPPARGRLPGVEDHGPGPRDLGDEPRGQGGDAAEPLEEVEGGPLQAEERPHRARDAGDLRAGFEPIAIGGIGASRNFEPESLGRHPEHRQARQDPRRSGHEPGRPPGVLGDRRTAGQVALGAEVFGEGQGDQVRALSVALGRVVAEEGSDPSRARGSLRAWAWPGRAWRRGPWPWPGRWCPGRWRGAGPCRPCRP